MVLWELTLATAYFLGLRRTYRLALKIQRKVLPRNPRIREFAQRRTRGVFDVVIQAQNKIKSWDVSAGRSLGSFLLGTKKSAGTTTKAANSAAAAAATSAQLSEAATSIQNDAAGKMHLPTKARIFSPLQARMKSLRMPSPTLSSTFGLKKDAHKPGRLYSLLSERARLRGSLIREDIAAHAGLLPKGH